MGERPRTVGQLGRNTANGLVGCGDTTAGIRVGEASPGPCDEQGGAWGNAPLAAQLPATVRDCHTRAGCRPSRAQERPRWPRSWFSLSASSIRLRITAPRSGSSVVSRSVGAPCDAPSFGMLDTAFGCALPSEQLGKLVRLSGLAPKPGLRAANSSRFTRSRSPFGFGPGGRSLFCVGALCGCQRRWLSPVRLLSLEVSGGQPVRPRRSSALGASASRRLSSARP